MQIELLVLGHGEYDAPRPSRVEVEFLGFDSGWRQRLCTPLQAGAQIIPIIIQYYGQLDLDNFGEGIEWTSATWIWV